MAQIIIYQNPYGPNVVTCRPAPDVSIEEALQKACPEGAIIVDDSILPQGDDAEFFDAWVLNEDNTISVNLDKAKSDLLVKYNGTAVLVAQKRQLNTLTGLTNTPDDATFIRNLNADRIRISSANSTTELLNVAMPS